MNSVDSADVPYRPAEYEDQVWNRLEPKLGASQPLVSVVRAPAVGSGVCCCRRAGDRLFGGPLFSRAGQPQVAGEASAVRERVLLVAVGDHLERSKMLLVELANADPPGNSRSRMSGK